MNGEPEEPGDIDIPFEFRLSDVPEPIDNTTIESNPCTSEGVLNPIDRHGTAALRYILRMGLGQHFINTSSVDFTQADCDTLTETEFDAGHNPYHADLYRFVRRRQEYRDREDP